jgi:molecular chaperone GrpE
MQDEEQDITLDGEEGIDDSVLAEEAQGDTIKKLKEKLKEAEGKAKDHLDNWQRAQAEFVNLRKRDEEAKGEFLKFAKADLIKELLPVLDSFSQAMAHGQKEVEPIYDQMLNILKANGVTELNPLGQEFNPAEHEALAMVPTDKQDDDHKVLDVLQKGYMLGSRIIRPAKVRIGEYQEGK